MTNDEAALLGPAPSLGVHTSEPEIRSRKELAMLGEYPAYRWPTMVKN